MLKPLSNCSGRVGLVACHNILKVSLCNFKSCIFRQNLTLFNLVLICNVVLALSMLATCFLVQRKFSESMQLWLQIRQRLTQIGATMSQLMAKGEY